MWGGSLWGPALRGRARCAQLLRNLRQGVQTLHVCGDWAATDDAVLDMSTDAVWVQGRAARKRISTLQARRACCGMQAMLCRWCASWRKQGRHAHTNWH